MASWSNLVCLFDDACFPLAKQQLFNNFSFCFIVFGTSEVPVQQELFLFTYHFAVCYAFYQAMNVPEETVPCNPVTGKRSIG
jgi:hypothetical protein